MLSDNKVTTLIKSNKSVSYVGLVLAALLIIVALIHHHLSLQAAELDPKVAADFGLYYFSLAFAIVHVLIYGFRIMNLKSIQAK